jgi:threonine/homoserine/homoserine lactone efflux protein
MFFGCCVRVSWGEQLSISHALIAFTLAAALLTITPGLDTALVLRTAAVEGPRRAMLAGVGICCGLLAWGFAAAVGLGALLAASRVGYQILRIVGACYLVFLGAKLMLRKHAAVAETENGLSETVGDGAASASVAGWFVRGLFTDLLNPKVGIFYVTFLPQFIPSGSSVTPFSMLLAGIHVTQTILWFALLISATRPLSRWLQRRRVAQSIDRVTGAALIGFGVGLALDYRR